MTNLPSGWSRPSLGEVARITAKLVDPADYPSMPHVAPNHIESGTGRLLPCRTVAEDGVTSPKYLFHDGEVLYSKIRPYLAKGTVAKFAGLCSADMYPLATEVDPRYLAYWLISPTFTAIAVSEQGRSLLPKINREALFRIPIPLAPQPEQRRIVEAIEEQLSRLDAAEDSLLRAKRNFVGLRKAKLASLFLAEWPTKVLSELTDPHRVICYGILKPKTTGDLRVPYVEVRSIVDGHVQVSSLPMTTLYLHQQFARSELRAGDVVLAIRGSFDRAAVVPPELAGANVSRDVARIAPIGDLDPGYLALFLSSPAAFRYFSTEARGVAVKGVNIRDIRRMPIPLPALEEQRAVVEEHERHSSLARSLEAEVAIGLAKSQALRNLILRDAFAGKLAA